MKPEQTTHSCARAHGGLPELLPEIETGVKSVQEKQADLVRAQTRLNTTQSINSVLADSADVTAIR